MPRISLRAVALAAAGCFATSSASAHCFVGNRFFPATLNVDDPCVADELSLPTVAAFPTGDDPSAREVDISGELSKKITDTFGISLEGTWIHTREPGGATTHGFDNLGTSFKFQFLTDPADEFVMSASLDVDWGGTGDKAVAESFSTLTPTLFIGKGFGFMPESLKYLKPLAITGQVGYAVPTQSSSFDDGEMELNAQSVVWGGSIQYSMPYLKSAVEDVGLPDFVNRLIPLVEWNLSTDTSNFESGEERTTGTINPGVIYVGDKYQISGEAIIPINRASGDGVGGMGQLHLYLDDIFPKTYGQPLFSASTQ
jgi:hypothetical protein